MKERSYVEVYNIYTYIQDTLYLFYLYLSTTLPWILCSHFLGNGANTCGNTYSGNLVDCSESMLDIEYMMAVAQVSPTTFWYDINTNKIK